MTPALSVDIKRRIVQLRQEGLTLRDIVGHLKVSAGVVHKTLEIYEEYGDRFLRSRDFTWKALTRPAKEANGGVRTCYQIETSGFVDPNYFVFIDESHVDQKTAHRSNGWSPVGVRSVEQSTFLRVRHPVLPALTTGGIVALEIFEGSVNKARFVQFLRDNVVCEFHTHSRDMVRPKS